MRLPLPPPPSTMDATTRQWANDFIKALDRYFVTVPEDTTIKVVAYSKLPKIKGIIGVPIAVPDHPDGYRLIIWDGVNFQVFSPSGIL